MSEGAFFGAYRSILLNLDEMTSDAVFMNWRKSSEEPYRSGFCDVAHAIVYAMAEKSASNESRMYPALYCFRHYIELSLKRILDLGSVLSLNDKPPKIHSLKDLLGRAREVLPSAFLVSSERSIKWLDSLITEVSELDDSSLKTRYATNQGGRASFGAVPFKLSLRIFLEKHRAGGFGTVGIHKGARSSSARGELGWL